MKKIYIFILFILIPLSFAQEDLTISESKVNIDKSVNWLMQQPQITTMEAALTTLAATKSDIVNDQDAAQKLLNLKHNQYSCWSQSNCNVKDTALALLALSKVDKAASSDWLNKKEIPNTNGDFYLQIETLSTGTCSISYKDKTKTVNVDRGRIKSDYCPFSTQFSLGSCLEPNLLNNKVYLLVTVQCSPLGSGRMSLVYKVEDKYFIVGEVSNTLTTILHLRNSNFGDYDSTLYAAWALKSMGQDVNSIMYLKRFYDSTSVVSASLMYLITEEDSYINDLLMLQDKTSGAFGSVYDTSLAILALRKNTKYTSEVGLAKSWIESQMQEDYTWNKDIKDTAIVIYGVYGSLDIPASTKPTTTNVEQPKGCNNNGRCEIYLGESNTNCPSDCYMGDGICESTSEDEISAPEDCKIEQLPEEPEEEVPEEEGHGFFFWFFILLILGAIGGLVYFYYKKVYLPKKQFLQAKPPMFQQSAQPRQQVYQRPVQPAYKPRKTLLEQELERSMQEAKKLLGKK